MLHQRHILTVIILFVLERNQFTYCTYSFFLGGAANTENYLSNALLLDCFPLAIAPWTKLFLRDFVIWHL